MSLFSPSLPILGPDEVTVPESELRARAVDAAWAELARLSRPGSRTAHRYPDPARDWIRLTVGPVSAGYETITLIMSPTAPAWMREIAHRARDEAARTGKSIEWTAQALEARVEVTVEAVGPNGPYQFVSGVFVSLCPTTGAEIWTWPPRTQGSWGARSAGIGTPVGVAAADPMRTWKRAPDASGDYTRHIWAQEDSIVLLDYCEATGLARVPYGGSYRTYRVPPSVRRALKPWSPPGE